MPHPQSTPRRSCSVEGCSRPHYGKGLCQSHYRKQWLKSRPHHPRILLTPEQRAISRLKARSLSEHKRRTALRSLTDEIKLASGCVECGYREHPAALDFDHLPDYEKGIDISQITNIPRMLEEVKKCEVVCANCHRIRTWKRLKGLA